VSRAHEPGRKAIEASAEWRRIREAEQGTAAWRRFGPYLAERQWGTVREDYSAEGDAWGYFTHDQARSRAYRWGEDGLLGICDDECRACVSLALWNGRDAMLKERLFGLTGPQGNHGEDVKELYYYLDATPTFSYLSLLYKYPQRAFPYQELVELNGRLGREAPELELEDTGAFEGGRYFDVFAEYAKAGPDDVLIRISCVNRGPEPAELHLLPQVWLRNTWAWGRTGEGYWPAGRLSRAAPGTIAIEHPSLGRYELASDGAPPRLLFTDNETNALRLFGAPGAPGYAKDAFHRLVVLGEESAVNPEFFGTKAAFWQHATIPAGGQSELRLRLRALGGPPGGASAFAGFDSVFAERKREADEFHRLHRDAPLTDDERRVVRQSDASLLASRQYYGYAVEDWLEGDPSQPAPPPERRRGRNAAWTHLRAHDLILMPDKWEYPWFAAWDLAFHCVALARVDPELAKQQVLLLCREWYMHPNGQLPAYEFGFGDVNPPVHAWAAWRVYQLAAGRGYGKDRLFLERAFQKCIVNFTWWVNRKDVDGNNLFAGGFLGLDNIGVFDRSQPLPGGERFEQADGTAWMAFYATTMLAMALELAREDQAYADIASTYFEHFMAIAQAMNAFAGTGLWDEDDGFYYDHLRQGERALPMRIRSMVGLIPLFAAETLDEEHLERLPLFRSRMRWFLENRADLAQTIACLAPDAGAERRLLAIPPRARLLRILRYLLDENEFLSPHGVRSLSRFHLEHPFVLDYGGRHEVRYEPGVSHSGLFGGNSNWRGPVWLPLNYLLVEALKRHHHFYRDTLEVECPTGSGRMRNLLEVAEEIELRLARLFLPGPDGGRPCLGGSALYREAHSAGLLQFHEYFDGDDGRGLGASHQTGWTALVANVLERTALARARRAERK